MFPCVWYQYKAEHQEPDRLVGYQTSSKHRNELHTAVALSTASLVCSWMCQQMALRQVLILLWGIHLQYVHVHSKQETKRSNARQIKTLREYFIYKLLLKSGTHSVQQYAVSFS